jgi:hypothetical protein
MITLKRIDFYGQLSVTAAGLLLILVNWHVFLLPAYIAVGSWQFLSCLLHYFNRDHLLRQKSRHFFESILVIFPLAVAVCFIIPAVLPAFSTAWLWISPILSAWYCYINYIELNIWEARALIQLR